MVDLSQPNPSIGAPGFPAFKDGTVRDAAAFRARIEAFQKHVEEKQHALFKRVLHEALTGLVFANPVGEPSRWKAYVEHPNWKLPNYVGGHSRRNWQVSAQPFTAEIGGVDPGGQQSLGGGYAAIASIPLTQKRAYLTNPVPYMERLNQGWSKQATPGWIDRILQAVLQKYARVQ